MANRQPRSLLRIWSARYFLFTIAGALTIIVATSILFRIVKDARMRVRMAEIASEMAMEAAAHGGHIAEDRLWALWSDERLQAFTHSIPPVIIVWDEHGGIVQQFPPAHVAPESEALTLFVQEHWGEIAAAKPRLAEHWLPSAGRHYIVASHPIPMGPTGDQRDLAPGHTGSAGSPVDSAVGPVGSAVGQMGSAVGYATLSLPKLLLTQMWAGTGGTWYRRVALMVYIIANWWIIYFLTLRMSRPITAAATAAKKIVAGEFDVSLPVDHPEREIVDLTASFREMAARLEHLESLRNQLVAGVTHELRTPITSISGLVQAVKDGVVSGKEAEEFLEAGLHEIDRMFHLIDDLLQYGKTAGGTVSVRAEVIDPLTTIEQIVERWRLISDPENRLEFVWHVAEEARRCEVLVDPMRLEQILVNLLNNAKEAMNGRGRMTLSLAREDNSLLVHVQDTGRGVPPHERADLFVPFFRGEKRREHNRGLGLGLPFSRLIARSCGGDLLLTESSEEGSIFTLKVPTGKRSKEQTLDPSRENDPLSPSA